MKVTKKIGILFIILLFSFGTVLFFKKEEKTMSVYKEQNETDIYYLEVSKENWYHTNIEMIRKTYPLTILRVYPKVRLSIADEKIETELEMFYFYSAETFYRQYSKVLQKYALHDDLEKLEPLGIPIQGLAVEATKEDIVRLKKDYPQIQVVDDENLLKQ